MLKHQLTIFLYLELIKGHIAFFFDYFCYENSFILNKL